MSTFNGVNVSELPIPKFFNSANASSWEYYPNTEKLFRDAVEWRTLHSLKPSGGQKFDVQVLIIDKQKDFCNPRGSLYVAGRSGTGAIDDCDRASQWIYKNLGIIKEITTSLDTHYPIQIFFTSFWIGSDGKPLQSHTLIRLSADERRFENFRFGANGIEVIDGDVKPNPAIASWVCNGNYPFLIEYCKHYCRQLAKGGKYTLYLWPFHCEFGSPGYDLQGVIYEAVMFHAFTRQAPSHREAKGGHILSENYSVLSQEVMAYQDGSPLTQINAKFVSRLQKANMLVVFGEAASHCDKSTIEDVLIRVANNDPKLAQKIYVVRDLMSSVVVRDPQGNIVADFTPDAEKALDSFASSGMHVVDSTTPIAQWPGVQF